MLKLIFAYKLKYFLKYINKNDKENWASFNFHIQTNIVIISDESYSEINFLIMPKSLYPLWRDQSTCLDEKLLDDQVG